MKTKIWQEVPETVKYSFSLKHPDEKDRYQQIDGFKFSAALTQVKLVNKS